MQGIVITLTLGKPPQSSHRDFQAYLSTSCSGLREVNLSKSENAKNIFGWKKIIGEFST